MATIRKGNQDDCAAMAEIFNHYILNSNVIFSNRVRSAEDMRQLVEPVVDRFPFYVAESSGKVIGYCFAHKWMPDPVYGRTLEITIYLSHEATGQHIGSQLLERVIDDCHHLGTHRLISFITEGNEPCERLHAAHGFRLMGVLPEVGYKFGRYLNDAIYLKDLC